VISGGAQLTGWQPFNTSKNIWVGGPSGLATPSSTSTAAAIRATGALPVSVKQTSTGYTTSSGDPMANWTNQSQIEFV